MKIKVWDIFDVLVIAFLIGTVSGLFIYSAHSTNEISWTVPEQIEVGGVVSPLTTEELEEQMYYDSLELLAICVEAEAGNQDLKGKRLVVDAILNRVDSDRFPNSITEVITQSGQFSSYTDGHMDAVLEPSEETFEAVKMELEDRLDSEVLFFTEGSYNPYCEPMFKYGAHYFGR